MGKSIDTSSGLRLVVSNAITGDKPGATRLVQLGTDRWRQRLECVARIVNGWAWETDTAHRFVYMSDSVAEFAGRPPEWHYGKTRQELGNINPDAAEHRDWLRQLADRRPFGPVEFTRQQDGATISMRTLGEPQFDSLGTFTGYCGIAFDVTDEVTRRHEKERAIGARAAAMHAKASAEWHEQQKSRFVETMTNELMRPLEELRALLDRITVEPAEQAAALNKARAAAKRTRDRLVIMSAMAALGTDI